ncbi:hypothetical protein [Streptomyces sp. NPDC002533]
MKISYKLATGAVALMSAAALSGATAPAIAAPQAKAPQSAVPTATEATIGLAAACPSKWKKAGGVPGKWSTAKDQCSIFGRPGYKAVYQWSATRGKPCIQVLGFDSKGRDKWHNAGCGKTGAIKVPWGNVAANKIIKIKGASLLEWR